MKYEVWIKLGTLKQYENMYVKIIQKSLEIIDIYKNCETIEECTLMLLKMDQIHEMLKKRVIYEQNHDFPIDYSTILSIFKEKHKDIINEVKNSIFSVILIESCLSLNKMNYQALRSAITNIKMNLIREKG